MDKILAFSILSSSPADISAAGFLSTRLSWRTSAAGKTPPQPQQAGTAPPMQEKADEQQRAPAQERQREARPRFALEFDGLNCFESIVSF